MTMYSLMVINRTLVCYLGINSAVLRSAAVQKYIPEKMRARINAFQGILVTLCSSIFSLLIGLLGEVIDYRSCITCSALLTLFVCMMTIFKNRKHVDKVYRS